MKNVKVLLLGLLFSFSFFACKDDDLGDLLPPGADFSYTPSAPIEGQEILFYADPTEASGEIIEWNWNFGDAEGSTSNKRNPYFTYASAGTYEVTLTVRNAGGASYNVSKSVEVSPPPKEFIANIVWEFSNNTTVSAINEGSSSPIIGDDGTIYYLESRFGNNGNVVAVTDQGESAQLKWATQLTHYIANAPSMGPDGNIYVNTWDNAHMVYKLNGVDGAIMWSGSGRGASNTTPAIDAQGNIYHGSRMQDGDGGAYSWTSTGEKRWEIVGVGSFYAAPVLSRDGNTVYFYNASEGKVWAVNSADGTAKWTESVGVGKGTHGTSLSMDADGTIYYTTNENVAAVTDNGTSGAVKWSTAVTGAAQSGVVIGPNGHLYSGSGAGLISINPTDGSINWTHPMSTNESVPAVDVEGRVYLGSTDGKLVVVNALGQLLNEIELGDGVVNSPTIADDGTVYVEGIDGAVVKLYKIAVDESAPANSPWPMKGQNVKNIGRAK
ncbi:outer membrane protein assembly factor BamB family protein [Pontibacter harenae]|uniref:outer membrane protein assembly factor BamB family protein n=1 Tax=Pontibacter harenae TaxID=2894083 RepID=UPI001E571504|nr:PQQ-binding-like beta-propeller repeat protein [Pontibacter harenae]MCC9168435.1 PQQ-binding-like beta-propeller repeat protein [Pontibacter harenae]